MLIRAIFSVKSALSKCNGEHLFRITRKQLQQYCGEEANRLYSLITVQKKRANVSLGLLRYYVER